jgi:N-acetylglucosamine-6-sulfatase
MEDGECPPVSRRGTYILREPYKRIVLFVLIGVFASVGITASQTQSSLAQVADPPRPNIVFILADDMRASDLNHMPNTESLLTSQGVKFTKAWVTRSLCCPSRVSTLRGQYTHNHNVWVNVPPMGGFWNFYDNGLENSTIATWLDAAGYDTILIGKYLNRYGLDRDGNYAPTTHVPPGWDEWYAWEGAYPSATTYDINENGHIVRYNRSDIHDTDLHAQTAEDFIRRTAGDGSPFFMYLAPNAPHHPSYYASEHASMFSSTALPKPSSFNEADVSDKPAWVRNKPRLSSTQISDMTQFYRKRLRALQSVDEMVAKLVNTLSTETDASGKLLIDNTYIVFTSDNGIYLGEHRLTEKAAAYNAAPRVPLLIRGPRVPSGVTRPQMALNNDLAPTFADLAGVAPPAFVDGRSLRPMLAESPPATWRTAFLVEHRSSGTEYGYVKAIPEYFGMRTAQYSYVEYETGEKELYDLNADPTELTNIYYKAGHSVPPRPELKARLDALKQCKGTGATQPSCEAAEGR